MLVYFCVNCYRKSSLEIKKTKNIMVSQLANSVCLSVLMALGCPWQNSKLLLGVDTKEQILLVPVPNGPVNTHSKQQLHDKLALNVLEHMWL